MTRSHSLRRFTVVLAAACLSAAAAAWAQEDQTPTARQLHQRSMAAHTAGDYALFLKLSQQAHQLEPTSSVHMYNMACGFALTGNKSEALKWLEEAIGSGFRSRQNLELMKTDPDLESIRGLERFALLVKYAETGEAPPVSAHTVDMEVFRPAQLDPNKKYPLIVALHGYGKNPTRALDNWKEAAEEVGAVLIAPQGGVPMSSSAFQWGGDPGQAVPLVIAAVEKASQDLPVDPDRVVLAGFSQGGSLAYEAARKHPELFCGLIPVAARYTPAKGGSAKAETAAGAKPKLAKVFIMVGSKDRAIVLESTKQAVADFEALGCKVESHTYPGIGRAFPDNRLAEQTKALKFILGTE